MKHGSRKDPNLTNLRVFGYPCYVYIPSAHRIRSGPGHKLLPKAQRMIMAGYADNYKAWKLFNPVTSSIVISNHVQFDQEKTPINGPLVPVPTLIDSVSLPTGSGLRGNNNTENSVSPSPSTIEFNETISTNKCEVPGSQNVSNDTRPVDLSETD
jgi:hypothetical protein